MNQFFCFRQNIVIFAHGLFQISWDSANDKHVWVVLIWKLLFKVLKKFKVWNITSILMVIETCRDGWWEVIIGQFSWLHKLEGMDEKKSLLDKKDKDSTHEDTRFENLS